MSVLSPAQQWSVALTRHVSGNLSVIASSIIVYHVLLRIRKGQATANRSIGDFVTPYHRIMLGFSVADILFSFWEGLSTLVVPASTGVIYGYGTTATCSAQGFFSTFIAANHLYLASLSVYFLLKIRYNVSDDVLYRHYEIWLHAIPWMTATGSGALGIAMQLFNPMDIPEIGCWVAPNPVDCWNVGGPPCTRGCQSAALGTLYAFVMGYIWLFLAFFVVLWCNVTIYRAIRQQERRNEQYLASRLQHMWSHAQISATMAPPSVESRTSNAGSNVISNEAVPIDSDQRQGQHEVGENENRLGKAADSLSSSLPLNDDHPDMSSFALNSGSLTPGSTTTANTRGRTRRCGTKASRTAFVQSILYVSSAGFTVMWLFLPYLAYTFRLSARWNFTSVLLMAAIVPLQGVFNLVIFVRLEYLKLRSSSSASRLQCVYRCLFDPDITDPGMFKSRRSLGRQRNPIMPPISHE